jgi:two-component system sensor histidine kinase LytS
MDGMDVSAFLAILVLAGSAVVALLAGWPRWVIAVTIVGLAVTATVLAIGHILQRPDHLRAVESDRTLAIARATATFLRGGLTPDIAQAVSEIILADTDDVAAVAITNDQQVLGFAGVGADHHGAVRPIVTRATHRALDQNRAEVIGTKKDIGCPHEDCPLHAAIIVPLEVDGRAVGTLKYYYTNERALTETELAAAEGLARLLSTQLEIHRLQEQAALVTEMELKALQAQINPHFLFNTLNTIGSYIRTDSDAARHLLRQFAAFYRRTLQHGDEPITLELELEFLLQYFELEQARFGDRVHLDLNVDRRLAGLPMPSFMLQPLVENCIAHGMRPDGSPLTIEVQVSECAQTGDWIFKVTDDGVGMDLAEVHSATDGHEGVGESVRLGASGGLGIALKNVADRLRGYYGADTKLKIDSTVDVGTTVSFRIPASQVPKL